MRTLLRLTASAAMVLSTGAISFAQHYTQTNLVSNTSGVAAVTDPQLVNPWGLSRGSGTPWWISDNGTGFSTLYNGAGAKQSLIVTIPPSNPNNKQTPTGTPTGTIFNGSTTDFLLAPGDPATFLFSTIDGTIAGWNAAVAVAPKATPPSTHAVTVVKTTDGSSYTGLTSAFINGNRYLYTANFTKGRVDVYNNAFQRVHLPAVSGGNNHFDDFAYDEGHHEDGNEPFVDDRLPRNFVPFNVQSIGNDIVVTYVLHQEGQQFETDGPGLGYVDIYSSSGQLLRRLEHGDWLNAPWGVALAPLDFGRFSHDLLIGQFAGGGTTQSSGFIAAYDLSTGKFDGLLQDATGNTLSINGIWAISPGDVSPSNSDASKAPAAELYFTAVTNKGTGGLFGYLTAVSAELIKGNDQ
jgi:uncharacterized protein (TIGR03118 family)